MGGVWPPIVTEGDPVVDCKRDTDPLLSLVI